MIQISIKKQDKVTNQGFFSSREEAQDWLSRHENIKTFGQPKQVIQQQIELSPAILAEDGSILQEAVLETKEIELAGDYEVEIIDITSQLEQEKVNAEALAFLAATDFYIIRELDNGVPCPADIKAKRQDARNRITK